MTRRTARLIKICGVRTEADVRACAEADADLVGIVRFERSPRFVDADRARELVACARELDVEPVELFVDASLVEIEASTAATIQLHGSEDERTVSAVASLGRRVIRGFRDGSAARARWDACDEVDTLLVDGGAGGTGEPVELEALASERRTLAHPLLLAGGLDPSNVARAIERIDPEGVDVSSGVERVRGEKDHALVRAFCDAVRALER